MHLYALIACILFDSFLALDLLGFLLVLFVNEGALVRGFLLIKH